MRRVFIPFVLLVLGAATTAAAGHLRAVGDVTTTSISGYAGNQATLRVTSSARSTWVLFGIAVRRSGARACGITAQFWTRGDDAPGADGGDEKDGGVQHRVRSFDAGGCDDGRVAASVHFDAPHGVDGVQICTDDAHQASERMATGIGLAASPVTADGSGAVKAKDVTTRCKIWHTARRCPSGQHAVGLVVDYRANDGAGYIQGLSLQCAAVEDE